jgi:hypothetical protein
MEEGDIFVHGSCCRMDVERRKEPACRCDSGGQTQQHASEVGQASHRESDVMRTKQ